MCLLLSVMPAKSQIIKSKLDLTAGVAAREFAHIGLRYQYYDITQIGVAYGGDIGFRPDEVITTLNVDHMVHFGKLSYYTNRPAWYCRQGYTYSVNNEGAHRTSKYSYLLLSLGREFAVNNWLGFNADLGVNWQIMKRVEENGTDRKDNLRYWMPLARLQVFISF